MVTGVDTGKVFGLELMVCSFLVMSWLSLVDPFKFPYGNFRNESGALYMFVTYFAVCAVEIRWNNVGGNPVRAMGPGAIVGNFINHWVYWMGPLMGGMLGALLHELMMFLNPQGMTRSSAKVGAA